jgi:CDGSH-type Zn-finger protein
MATATSKRSRLTMINTTQKAPSGLKSSAGKIVVSNDGPYIVSGNVPLAIQVITPNREGLSWDWKEGKNFETGQEYNLCRCGRSKTKPFCDGTHTKIRFDGAETATRRPYVRRAEVFEGPTLTLRALKICVPSRGSAIPEARSGA